MNKDELSKLLTIIRERDGKTAAEIAESEYWDNFYRPKLTEEEEDKIEWERTMEARRKC